jgi:hypothetical protein
MPALTLLQGDARAEYIEHPTEMARKALLAAAEVETPLLANRLVRIARLLPKRGPLLKGGE